jgi:hypothetical protein
VAKPPLRMSSCSLPRRGRRSTVGMFTTGISSRRSRKLGLRHFRIHDLRHTYRSLLIQAGASLAYVHVRDQLGHSLIQETVDLCGHLVPSANISWVDGLDSAETTEQSATPAQLGTAEGEGQPVEVIEQDGGPGRSRTADLRFRKPSLYPSELRGHANVTLSYHFS